MRPYPASSRWRHVHAIYGGSVLGVQNGPEGRTRTSTASSRWRSEIAPRVSKISHIVEKPKPDKAESTLAVVGRYLLSGSIFDDLAKIGKGAGGEIQLTDGIARLMQREDVYAFEFEGKRYDCGSKLGYLQATVEYGLKHPSLGVEFAAYLKRFVATL
jgi:UTP--glucose-1-phosphate uridylyltransferase